MSDLQNEFNNLISLEDTRYFYHFTGVDPEKILENGLIVGSVNWQDSFLEFIDEEKNNIDEVIDSNINNRLHDYHYMIIVGVDHERVKSFIKPLNEYYADWEGIGAPDYVIDPEYIIGYIDLDNRELVINENSNYLSDSVTLSLHNVK